MSAAPLLIELPGGGRVLFSERAHGNASSVGGEGAQHGALVREHLRELAGLRVLARGYQVHGSIVQRVRVPPQPEDVPARAVQAGGGASSAGAGSGSSGAGAGSSGAGSGGAALAAERLAVALEAELEGASLEGASLDGASNGSAPHDGASTDGASDHGASSDGAHRLVAPSAEDHADGQATALRLVGATVLTADCLPVALGGDGAVAMVHAGWRGLAEGVLDEGVRAARELGGVTPTHAVIGPGAGVCCYEVGPEVQAAFGAAHRRGRNLDLHAIAREQLLAAGVREVIDLEICTICDERFFSHRRERERAGRQAAIAWRS